MISNAFERMKEGHWPGIEVALRTTQRAAPRNVAVRILVRRVESGR